ncbi:SAM-dependent methyltransferase [Streptomyces sp. DSM 44917]|uniref:SAM-dependent methyltransferase n=1 Tax=Streptomyces boetiae TaxID=3075541 RepID=A0ABU2L1Q8_9ACTN|nr:SAM-dependent methyltransferase [Streptomyces sp. DSM 44917]MDT0305460.1 SAM-dependent methyltransferase [Streptomyces sp. DSM 44917]
MSNFRPQQGVSAPPPGVDPAVPHSPRVWNYWLGGEDHYPADREAGERVRSMYPGISDYARANRAFLGRAVRLAVGGGVRQFLDIGAGLPTADNTHQVAQRAAPEARVVYVDNDPLVLAQSGPLLTSTPEGATAYVTGDLHDPEAVLRAASRTLDLTRPVAVLLLSVMMFTADDAEAYGIIRRLMNGLAPGSHLILSHTVTGPGWEDMDAAVTSWNEVGTPKLKQRTPSAISGFFTGLDLLPPGIVSCTHWRPDGEPGPEVAMFCGVGRKP